MCSLKYMYVKKNHKKNHRSGQQRTTAQYSALCSHTEPAVKQKMPYRTAQRRSK